MKVIEITIMFDNEKEQEKVERRIGLRKLESETNKNDICWTTFDMNYNTDDVQELEELVDFIKGERI